MWAPFSSKLWECGVRVGGGSSTYSTGRAGRGRTKQALTLFTDLTLAPASVATPPKVANTSHLINLGSLLIMNTLL